MKARVRKSSDELSTSDYQKRQKNDENVSDSSTKCSAEDASEPRTMPSAESLGKTVADRSSMPLKRSDIDSEENASQAGRREPKISKNCTSPTNLAQNDHEELTPRTTSKEYYDAGGLKHFLHGISYQSKLLIHILKCGLRHQKSANKRYLFDIGTEVNAAEKFDDIVFRYKNNPRDQKYIYRFVQAKHKIDNTKVLGEDDLLSQEEKGEFRLSKYFVSFLRIRKNSFFRGAELRDFTICTNISLNKSLEDSCFEPVNRDDGIFDFEIGKHLKLNWEKFPKKDELKSALENESDCKKLAKRFAECIMKGSVINFKDYLFKLYHRALRMHVIEVKNKKQAAKKHDKENYVVATLYENFVDEKNLSPSVQNFRNVFFREYRGRKDVEIKIGPSYVKFYEFKNNPNLENDAIALASEIATCITHAENGIVKLERKKNIQKYIDELAEFVFIKKTPAEKDIYYFSQRFLNEDYVLPGDLKLFEEELRKLKNKSELLNLKFRITNFVTCEEDELLVQPDFPEEVSEQDITDFFNMLVFAVGMPDEIQLGHIIAKDMSDQLNLADSEFPTSSLETFIQNWMKDNKGYFLRDDVGENFFEKVTQKVSVLNVYGITLEYCAEIKSFGMEFCNIPSKLKNFLTSNNEQIFNLISSCGVTRLSAIKVIQALKDTKAYEAEGSFISIHLNSIKDADINDRLIKAFNSELPNNLLVIECGVAELAERQLLLEPLFSIIKRCNQKKIIFITCEHDILAEKLTKDFPDIKWDGAIDEKNSLNDLKDHSQEALCNREIIFQERETTVNLGALLTNKESKYTNKLGEALVGELLFELILSKEMKIEIKIGKAPKDMKYDNTKYHFIQRSFFRYINIDEKFKENQSEFVVIDKTREIVKSGIQATQDIILIADTNKDFIKCCNSYNNNIHWLKTNGDVYKWQQSRGSKSKLRKFIKTNAQSRENYELKSVLDTPDKVVLIAAEAGMGKSVILSHLAVNTPTAPFPVWIVRCNLVEYSFKFGKWSESESCKEIGVKEAVKFLYKIAKFQLFKECCKNTEEEDEILDNFLDTLDKGEVHFKRNQLKQERKVSSLALFEIELFTAFYNQGFVVLLLDGFDEIIPDYEHQVNGVIENLTRQLAKIWITTRSIHILGEAEDKFNTYSYQLTSFTPEDQKTFLMKFWREKLKADKLNEECSIVYIDQLLEKFSYKNELPMNFLSVPLQLYMVAEIFAVSFKEFLNSGNSELSEKDLEILQERLDLNSLYQKFTLEQYYVEQRKEDANYDHNRYNVGYRKRDEKHYAVFLEWHRKLAIIVTFKGDINKFPPEVIDFIENVEEGDIKSGIVQYIPNEMPTFIHRTFAEYFSADFLWKQFKLMEWNYFETFMDGIIFGNLFRVDRYEICAFLKSISEKDLKGNEKFSYSKEKFETLMMELLNGIAREKFFGNGMCTSLHVYPGTLHQHSSEQRMNTFLRHSHSFLILLRIIEVALSSGQVSVSKTIENWCNGDQYGLLCVCAELGFVELAKALIATIKDSENFLQQGILHSGWMRSILMIAIDNNRQNVAKFVFDFYDIFWKDSDHRTFITHILRENSVPALDFLLKNKVLEIGKPYMDSGQKKLLFLEAMRMSSSDVVEFLMDKTDIHVVDEFINSHGWSNFSFGLSVSLFQCNEKKIELGMKKGIDFTNTMNIFLSRFFQNFEEWGPPSIHLMQVFEKSELILKSGESYNCKNIKISDEALPKPINLAFLGNIGPGFNFKTFSSEGTCRTITLHYSECLYLICMLLLKAKAMQIIHNNFDIKSLGFDNTINCAEGYKILCKDRQQCLSHEDESFQAPQGGGTPVSFFPLKLDAHGTTLVQNALNEVYDFMIELPSDKIDHILKLYPHDGYPKDLLQDDFLSALIKGSERVSYSRLSESGKLLLKRIITISKDCNCSIYDSYENIRMSLKLKNMEQEVRKISSNEQFLFKTKDLLQILETQSSPNDFRKELLSVTSTIMKCGNYCSIGKTIQYTLLVSEIENLEKIYEKSKYFHELLKKLDKLYKNLTTDIAFGRNKEIDFILTQEPDYKKSIIHGQDDKFGSPLHYVASKGNAEITQILLSHGAYPNLRLIEEGIPEYLSTSKNPDQIKDNESWASDYYSWTPLHLAALNGHNEVVQLLIDNGAKVDMITDVEATNKGNTALHLSTLRNNLNTVLLLLKNGACYDAKNAQNKTPLELAEAGSDVAHVLQCIHYSFRAVKERRKDLVSSLLMTDNSVLLKAIFHAKNSDKKTLNLCIARANEQDDVIDLLEEKLRSLQF
ncbi:uncharacterized protein LOC135845648 [Planococcus citri]|uniref:uncharacterized protein LOC135845648 n=1 Tax=Planococcus citri TaxID=170843 RepID=UPI0031F84368